MKSRSALYKITILLLLGIIIGSHLNNIADLFKSGRNQNGLSADIYELQDKFINIAEETSKAVVGISVSSVVRGMYLPTPYQDDFFRFFFGLPERQYRQRGMGSGFIVDKRGYILTNEHVIHQADDIEIILPDGRKFKGKLTGADVKSDLAVIKIDAENLSFIEMGDSDKVKTGQWAVAVGNPFAIFENNPQPTMTLGIVSAVHRSFPTSDMGNRYYGDLIQTDAAINPGNSGGPLLDINGKVIGINVAILSRTGESAGIGFALPVNQAKRILNKLIAGKSIKYGWIGVAVQDLSPELIKTFNLKTKEGALVGRVMQGAPADKAGIRRGDIITKVNGKKIGSVDDLIYTVSQMEIGKQTNVELIRNGKLLSLPLLIGESNSAQSGQEEQEQVPQQSVATSWRGMQVADLTPEFRKQFELEEKEGILIVEIQPGSPAEMSGLKVGDVIDEINRKPVRNTNDFVSITSGIKGDILIHTYNHGYIIIRE